METCLKIAPTCPPVEDRQHPRLAIEANKLPIRGAYLSFLSLSQLKFALLWLFTIPSVSTQGAFSAYSAFGAHFFTLLRPFTIPSVSHQDLVRLVRTFLQAPLEASTLVIDTDSEACFGTAIASIHPFQLLRRDVRKRVHAGLPIDVYPPVKVNSPVFRSTRKDAILSLRWLHA
jgi:hypothetical protein